MAGFGCPPRGMASLTVLERAALTALPPEQQQVFETLLLQMAEDLVPHVTLQDIKEILFEEVRGVTSALTHQELQRQDRPYVTQDDSADEGMVVRQDPVGYGYEFKLAATSEFRKAVASVDKNMKGRVLEALMQITTSPTTPRGDTVKPLLGDSSGYWRYRIGDYRLIYLPRVADHAVVLVSFGPRGTVYKG